MENVKMLLPIELNAFWLQLKNIVEQALKESKTEATADSHLQRPLLKTKEVCAIFHVSKPTIYEWLKKGKINSVKIQSRRYFHWKDVEDLIQQSKVSNLKNLPDEK